jgi:hypothetical protein
MQTLYDADWIRCARLHCFLRQTACGTRAVTYLEAQRPERIRMCRELDSPKRDGFPGDPRE